MALQAGLERRHPQPGLLGDAQGLPQLSVALRSGRPAARYFLDFARILPEITGSAPAAAPAVPGTAAPRIEEAAVRHHPGHGGGCRPALHGRQLTACGPDGGHQRADCPGAGRPWAAALRSKTVFLPQLLMSAEAAKAAFEQVRAVMPAGAETGPIVLLATVQGDIHDIGKNIVMALLENYGYRVVDLGRDVPPHRGGPVRRAAGRAPGWAQRADDHHGPGHGGDHPPAAAKETRRAGSWWAAR
jgi:hypothetical protein